MVGSHEKFCVNSANLKIRKLYVYFVYCKLYLYFVYCKPLLSPWDSPVPLKNDARTGSAKLPVAKNTSYMNFSTKNT